jgi:hypothetical protein
MNVTLRNSRIAATIRLHFYLSPDAELVSGFV